LSFLEGDPFEEPFTEPADSGPVVIHLQRRGVGRNVHDVSWHRKVRDLIVRLFVRDDDYPISD
jgi:hypothetical protein